MHGENSVKITRTQLLFFLLMLSDRNSQAENCSNQFVCLLGREKEGGKKVSQFMVHVSTNYCSCDKQSLTFKEIIIIIFSYIDNISIYYYLLYFSIFSSIFPYFFAQDTSGSVL